jgi:phytoene synthase
VNAAVEQCKETIAQNSKSFALASRLLPEPLRTDAIVLYAYCRHVDDAIDLVSKEEHAKALSELRRELDDIFSGNVTPNSLNESFHELFVRRKIPRFYVEELLNGMEMDCQDTTYSDVDQLLRYCYRVAGTVGLMMCHVLSVSSPVALEHAAHLGIAMQLTNICRDVDEDAKLGRLYLPRTLLERHGTSLILPSKAQSWSTQERQAIAEATIDLLLLADLYYHSGDAGLRYLPAHAAFAVSVARKVYSEIGSQLLKRHGKTGLSRAFVSKPRKIFLALTCLPSFGKRPKVVVPMFPERPLSFEMLPLL